MMIYASMTAEALRSRELLRSKAARPERQSDDRLRRAYAMRARSSREDCIRMETDLAQRLARLLASGMASWEGAVQHVQHALDGVRDTKAALGW